MHAGLRRRGIALLFPFLLFAALPLRIAAQSTNFAGVLTLRLEERVGDNARIVPQNTVFKSGSILRFRLTSQLAGFLYIVDKGTTGETATLFPASENPNASNRIEPGQSMVVPANGDGWFEVSGPSGFDTIYILVSADPISIPPAVTSSPIQETPQNETAPPSNLLPRCDDAIFKARGECIDKSAGVAPLPPNASVPRELIPLARTAARDIILADDADGVTVKPAPTAKLPLIYTFRLAHLQ
ncbi:MAG TPA: DUF4384 domain-containing protein [Terracidiphilus sp.]|nr:DUF4384 domain-containing protein [Terracidiphilus sp.]